MQNFNTKTKIRSCNGPKSSNDIRTDTSEDMYHLSNQVLIKGGHSELNGFSAATVDGEERVGHQKRPLRRTCLSVPTLSAVSLGCCEKIIELPWSENTRGRDMNPYAGRYSHYTS